MAEKIQKGLDYHKAFDPKRYLAQYITAPDATEEGNFHGPMLKTFHEIFNSDPKPGSRLLDIGTGPSIYQLISASRHCTEIVCSEYTEANRVEINKWLKRDPGMHDWAPFFKFVADLEGDSSSWEFRESQLRDAIKEVVPCDVTKPDSLAPRQYDEFDVMTTTLCLETACPDRGSYSAAVRNITRLLKPGGTLVLAGVINETFYRVGDYKFYTLTIDSSFIREVLEKAGYVDINIKSFPATNAEGNHLADFGGIVVLSARKAMTQQC